MSIDPILSRIPPWPGTAAFADAVRDPKSLFALLAVVVLVLYGLSVGRTRALVSLLSIYVAYMLAVLFPFLSRIAEKLPGQYQSLAPVGLFIVLYALTFTILSQSMLKGRLTLGEISLWQVLIISLVQIGLLASICVSLVPLERGQQLLGPLYRWFGGQYPLWGWAVASLLIMPFMRSRRSRD
jgi:hypothetical protein